MPPAQDVHWLFATGFLALGLCQLAETLVAGSAFPLVRSFRPGSAMLRGGYAVTMVTVAVLLYCDRDVAPIFGHLSQYAR